MFEHSFLEHVYARFVRGYFFFAADIILVYDRLKCVHICFYDLVFRMNLRKDKGKWISSFPLY